MAGCEAEGATFAISHLVVEDPSQAGAGLAQWRVAVLARMQATATDAAEAEAEAEAGASSFVPSGALALPQSLRLQAQGRRSDGSPVAAQAVWFARLEGQQARLYHAVVYTATPQTAVADTFFAGLVLP